MGNDGIGPKAQASGFFYLASPYSSRDLNIQFERYRQALVATTWLLSRRIWVHSPIVHCHELATRSKLPTDFAFWRDYNFAMIEQSRGVIVLLLDGWKESKGVGAECAFALSLGLSIKDLKPEGEGFAFGKSEWRLQSEGKP